MTMSPLLPSAPRITTACSSFALAFAFLASTAEAQNPERIDERTAVRQFCSSGIAAELRSAGGARITAAEALGSVYDNPRVRLEHQRVLAGPEDNETIVGLAVPIPVSGRRGLLRDAARERRRQANAEVSAVLLESALELRASFARAVLDAERVSVSRAHQRALEQLRDETARVAKAGEAAAYDERRQRTEANLHAQRQATLEARAEASLAQLETWLPGGVRPAPSPIWDLARVSGRHELAAAARGRSPASPAVIALEANARASRLEARSARRRAIPEPELFGGYRSTSTTGADTGHGFAVALEVPLPLFDHGQSESAQAEAAAAGSLASASARRREDRALLNAALRRLGRLERALNDAETAAKDASAIESQAIALYRAGEAKISELLDALRSGETARLARIDLAEELVSARLELMRAAGKQLDAELDRACDGTRGPR
jgi:outer membrane protein, heavy metal efflux system